MNVETLRRAIEASREPSTANYQLADALVGDLERENRTRVYNLLVGAGIDGLKPHYAKSLLLQRLRMRLTASIRTRERAEV